ncbi:PTS system mannose/fructose/sorbose family transporter subunit IID [Geoalkalibacter halelectricus]|uniref:PTS system mannose/fructose/sorbose family transporter subunit IID n=1 Tax=Geoalkalibacter halelectricus TaxID=2847045 RepID=A0ABY5ZHY8_9BACT|nr:PTS system mannose/fructose/sorbose family transporter subunit IID [Geoalkalibacter halelectricus]MDO3379386.1 PTS system mannose/fructose/sorbose family transporter subunit IID [Geoalkalibacter halelectricus]UWZ78736.1 PTS system mannose/fructose/sorbose family transporter subunit IID [Geoalkalibacter halelectricus]
MRQKKLPLAILLRTLGRTFLLQASWSFERMQSLGALYIMAPALRYLYQGQDLEEAFRRHMVYFNTHPFMASPLLGATLSLEEAQARGEGAAIGPVEFREMVMAPFAAIGDALFWGGFRPLAAVIALFFAFKGSLWAPVVFLVMFNLPHLWFRFGGMLRGYFSGLRMVEVVQRRHLPDWAIRAKEATVVLLGGLCAYLTLVCLGSEGVASGWGLLFLPLVVALGWLTRKGASNLLLILATTGALLCLGFFL